MYISDVAKATGLSKKAIRFYESKGLLGDIERLENGYRDYKQKDIDDLLRIKRLRMAGIQVSDINLLFAGVVTTDELLEKRRRELEEQSGSYAEQFEAVKNLISKNNPLNVGDFIEEDTVIEDEGPFAVGLDIGTTSISAALLSVSSKKQMEVYTLENSSRVAAKEGFMEFSPEIIVEKTERLVNHILKTYKNVCSIGLTGQMHGVLYIDEGGKAVSNLINWQDGRGNMPMPSGKTCVDELYDLTGVRAATGFGFATHFYNAAYGLIPQNAVTFCSIMDYVGMRLCGITEPIIHNSVAASFSLFDIEANSFLESEIKKIEGFKLRLPSVTNDFAVLGEISGVPVAVAIGDNQASFLGAVKDLDNGLLINIGTGSQVSAVVDEPIKNQDTEIRPLIKGKYILCGSALCGGRAYAALEKFFRSFTGSERTVYGRMNALLEQAFEDGMEALSVDTRFCGTRSDISIRGAITGISEEGFTPGALCLGVVKGICGELYGLLPENVLSERQIVASGNAVKKIKILPQVMSEVFKAPIMLPTLFEEAAVGAALFSLAATGIANPTEWQQYISYKE